MSINDKNNGRGKIVMLALMMITSTFAVIGTTVADPTGMETVMWDAENGEMYTHEDGELVYEYDYPEDVMYDFRFVSDGLDVGETYSLGMALVDTSTDYLIYEVWYVWNATDYDGDGVADNSTEYLVDGSMVDMIANDTCYEAYSTLGIGDANAGLDDLDQIGGISQLVGFGDYEECYSFETEEFLTMEFRDANYADSPQPQYDNHTDTNVLLIPWGLHEAGTWCENSTTGEDVNASEVDCNADPDTMWIEETLTYDIHYWLHNMEDGFMDEVIFELVVEGDEYDVDVSANGCYDLMAQLFLNVSVNYDGEIYEEYFPVADSMEGFSVGRDCFSEPPEPPHVWSKADREFNPEMGVFDYYNDDETIHIEYGAWNLEPYTTHTSVVMILGPFSHDDHDDPHEGPSFICGDGSEIPFDYVNDGDQDCPDGADEQQYNDDGTKLNWFDCHDGTQIWIDQVNDGVEDCADGEDEAGDHDGSEDGSLDGDNGTEHDDGESDYFCYDMDNDEGDQYDNQEDCELAGFMWIKDDDGEEYEEPEIALSIELDVGSGDVGDFMDFWMISGDVLEPGFYGVMHVVIIDGYPFPQNDEPSLFCVGASVCDMGPGEMSPWEHTTGHGYYQMHFDQFDNFENEEGNSFNGILEISSVETIDSSYRMYADANADGNVDPLEAMTFISMMAENMDEGPDEGPHECPFDMDNTDAPCQNVEACDPMHANYDEALCWDIVVTYCDNYPDDPGCEGIGSQECPFDQDHPDSPCNVEACSPEGYTEDGCHAAIEEYCANNDDPACMDMGEECPFDQDHPDSPCNVEVCDPSSENNNDSTCEEYVLDYCENINPDDPFCAQVHECPFDKDHPDSPCNVEVCDPSSANNNESACNEHVMDYCENINPDDPACDGGEEDGTQGNHCGDCGEDDDHDCTGDTCDHPSHDDDHDCTGDTCDHPSHDEGMHDHDHDDDENIDVTLDGVVLGEPTFEWLWIDGLVGPVDGSDGMPVTINSGLVWELSLEDWKTTDMHVVELSSSNADKPLMSQCNEDGLRGHGDVGHGVFAVYDSWAWSPEEPELEGDGWIAEADGDYGWNAPFNCADQGELQSLIVTFSKTLKDYNADNLEAEEAGLDGYDWEQDVEDNQAPTCHAFASTTNDGTNWEESEDHFEAPDGDYTIELTPGVWFLSVYCKDPDGDMVMGQVTANGETIEFLEEGEGHAFAEFPVMAGMPNLTVEYKWDSTGGHSGSGTITLVVEVIEDNTNNTGDSVEPITNDDGTVSCPPGSGLVLNADKTECIAPAVDNVGDIIEEVAADEGGSIPGFTTALSVISMLGAVLVMSRRKQDC